MLLKRDSCETMSILLILKLSQQQLEVHPHKKFNLTVCKGIRSGSLTNPSASFNI